MDHIHSNTIENVRASGRHLSLEERGMIQALHRQGLSLRAIAAEVGCAHTTVLYELRRGTLERKGNRGRAPQYTAKRGQKAYTENRKNSKNPSKIDHDDCKPFIQWHVHGFSDEDVLNMADTLSQCPRRALGCHTPSELFDAFLDEVYAIESAS